MKTPQGMIPVVIGSIISRIGNLATLPRLFPKTHSIFQPKAISSKKLKAKIFTENSWVNQNLQENRQRLFSLFDFRKGTFTDRISSVGTCVAARFHVRKTSVFPLSCGLSLNKRVRLISQIVYY